MIKLIKWVATVAAGATFALATVAAACTVAEHQKCLDAYYYTINNICPLSFDPALCRQGAVLEYDRCKTACSI